MESYVKGSGHSLMLQPLHWFWLTGKPRIKTGVRTTVLQAGRPWRIGVFC